MSRYRKARLLPVSPTKQDRKKNLHIIILTMVSCMCDNISYLKLTKKDEDTVGVSLYNDRCSLAFSNLQAEEDAKEMMKWAMLDNDLDEILRLANSGTEAVESIKIREKVKSVA